MHNIVKVQGEKVRCPKNGQEKTLNDCIGCPRLKMMQPWDGGEVWCKTQDDRDVRGVKVERR